MAKPNSVRSWTLVLALAFIAPQIVCYGSGLLPFRIRAFQVPQGVFVATLTGYLLGTMLKNVRALILMTLSGAVCGWLSGRFRAVLLDYQHGPLQNHWMILAFFRAVSFWPFFLGIALAIMTRRPYKALLAVVCVSAAAYAWDWISYFDWVEPIILSPAGPALAGLFNHTMPALLFLLGLPGRRDPHEGGPDITPAVEQAERTST